MKPIIPCSSSEKPAAPIFSIWKLFVDGASRNNPGNAGAGVYILKDSNVFQQQGAFLGKKTNNEAEYLALLLGVFELKQVLAEKDLVLIMSDSQLLVRQIAGMYKVKEPRLQKLYLMAQHLLRDINYEIIHVLRENNTYADELANKGIDNKTSASTSFIQFLQHHEFYL